MAIHITTVVVGVYSNSMHRCMTYITNTINMYTAYIYYLYSIATVTVYLMLYCSVITFTMNGGGNNLAENDVDQIILKLIEVCGPKTCKNANLSEDEITFLCLCSREIFASQPILLELEAPLKVCGRIKD